MTPTVITYLVYLAISIGLTVWVGRTLFANGRCFLVDIFDGNESLADAVNRLLIVGFYLVNLGYVALNLGSTGIVTVADVIEALAGKLGLVLLVLGGMHFLNLYVLNRARQSRLFPTPPTAPRYPLPPGLQPPVGPPSAPLPTVNPAH